MREIENKVAIVTGGSSGIGRAIALRFARAGGRVALLDVAEPAAREVAREIEACGGSVIAIRCDVSRQGDVDQAFQAVAQRFAPVDVLVNSAGIAHVGAIEQTSEEDLDLLYAVNVKGVYNCIAPGRVHTPFVDGFLAQHYPGRECEMFDTLSRTQPIGRMGRPEEVAD